ncbi:hypothetical protein ACFX13_014926 [Malus domestica]
MLRILFWSLFGSAATEREREKERVEEKLEEVDDAKPDDEEEKSGCDLRCLYMLDLGLLLIQPQNHQLPERGMVFIIAVVRSRPSSIPSSSLRPARQGPLVQCP